MAVKTKKISTLIESQLPSFISSEYELFSKFVQKYYEQQESQGQSLDIALNLDKYANIDFYEKSILSQETQLTNNISVSDKNITVNDASGFPEKNGYIQIGNEIIFYAERTDNLLKDCSRGISGNTQLGDIYEKTVFVTTDAEAHYSGETVLNISNLFLYGLIKNFESQYLDNFPQKYLKGQVDKRTLIKNIRKFYKSKGTNSSIQFIFNTIISRDITNKPSTYNPKDYTYKSSVGDWISVYALKAKVISGDPKSLIGKTIVQNPSDEYAYASATVDNVSYDGDADGEIIWNIILAPQTVNGTFAISTKTRLETNLLSTSTEGNRINVFSTVGWDNTGEILIDNEVIKFDDKNVTQFIIKERGSNPVSHAEGSSVYKPVIVQGSGATLLTLGTVYNVKPKIAQPYAYVGDEIEISKPGFQTDDQKINLTGTNQTRWILNQNNNVNSPTNPLVQQSLSEVTTDVAAIFADEQYYYIASSSYPSYNILEGSNVTQEVKDQKILRIIRKEAIRTTEVYKTPKRDIGILLNGVPIYGAKDEESIRFGILEEIKVVEKGTGYLRPPFVLVDGVPNKARSVLSGQVVDKIIVDTDTFFPNTPEITITSGRGASVSAVVTKGQVTSLVIDNPGEFYSSPPIVRIRDLAGKGRFAEYIAQVDTNGKIIDFEKIDGGNFYDQDTVRVDIIPVGFGAVGVPYLKEWTKNRFFKLSTLVDVNYGYVFENYNKNYSYGYGHIANPKSLRVLLNDNLNNAGSEPLTKTHSPIIGFAYDGNPIYGPFGYQDPLNPSSSIVRMTSSYSLKGDRKGGPPVTSYALGSFVNDYSYNHKSGSLDENNGRFCITPDYPDGTYAYFLTIDTNQVPQYPYFIGENFYSLPVESNYNSNINQNDVPKKSKRLYTPDIPKNGEGVIANIAEVRSGSVDSLSVVRSSDNFSVNSKIYFDNIGTDGKDAEAYVSSVKGRNVNYLQSKENKVVQLTTIQTAYLFENDTLRQPASGAYGEIVGTVASDNRIVLKNVSGTFNNTGTFSADIKTFSILLDQNSSYTKGAVLSLTNGVDLPIATGEILESTTVQNIVKIKVLSGVWIVDDEYFLQSSNLFNTIGSKIVTITSLSDNLEPFDVNQSVALIETVENHGLGIGDKINVDIFPDDVTKQKKYFLRKRLYQQVKLKAPTYTSTIDFTGVGRYQILNGGSDYTPGTYTNVLLTGGSGSGARATITVSSLGIVSLVTLVSGGSGYKKGDYLSVADETLSRSQAALGLSRLTIYVDHVGFASESTSLFVRSSSGLSVNDFLKIGNEVIKITAINNKKLTVLRAQKGTESVDHYNGQSVTLFEPKYNFGSNDPIFSSNLGTTVLNDGNGATLTTDTTIANPFGQYDGVLKCVHTTNTPGYFRRGQLVPLIAGVTYVFSFYFKNGTVSNPYGQGATSPGPGMLASTGVGGGTGPLFENLEKSLDTNIPVGNGWYRQIFTFTPAYTQVYQVNFSQTVNQSPIGTYYLYGFKLELENPGYKIFTSSGTGYIKSYDYETQEATVIFPYSIEKANADKLELTSTFFDASSPKKLVSVDVTNPIEYRFEFSDNGTDFLSNPTLNIQEYYSYKFDTSHSSLTGTYFDVSPSKNYNIITDEKKISTVLPGSFGSFTELKFGFGPRISDNQYNKKVGTKFTNYYYFDKNNIVASNDSYFRIITDPLQGEKTVTYVTPTRFVYEVTSTPLYDGSGQIRYTTSGQYAIGEIDACKIVNSGLNYKKVPIIIGCSPSTSRTAKATLLFDETNKIINGVSIDDPGSNYVNAKVIITKGDGVGATFDVVVKNGEIFSIVVENPGKGYTYAPEIEIVETDLEIYANSKNIGVPLSTYITRNGSAFHLDKTVSSTFSSQYVFYLSNISGNYQVGEIVVQIINDIQVASGIVSEWRSGSNLLKVRNINGTFRNNYQIKSTTSSNGLATIKSVYISSFEEEISSFYDNKGYYSSDRGKLSSSLQKITDSYFYQDYSYVLRSKTPMDQWRDLIKSTTHPAGFKLFGHLDVESTSSTEMPTNVSKDTSFVYIIELWDPTKNVITVESTYRTVTQTVETFQNQRIRKTDGFVSPSEFRLDAYRSFEFTLGSPFNGYYDADGRLQGTTMFQLLDDDGNPFTPANSRNLIITLDGVLQEPDVAYTVLQDKVIFSKAPLGPGSERTGVSSGDVTQYKGVKFYGRYFYFLNTPLNDRYLRKIRNIFQRNGRWLDAANQIEKNRTFIIEETIGYGKSKYPTLDWSSKTDDYQENIGYILDAYQHDLRFGGNVKTFDYVSIFRNDSKYNYITKNKSKALDIFSYATRLSSLAIRNWDIVENAISYTTGSAEITVSDSNRLVVGMYISCNRAFPSNTKIIDIISGTKILVSNTAISTSNSDQATFYLSGINNGTFYDAANLILKNKEHIKDEVSNYIYTTFNTLNQSDKQKCKRDLGYLIDAISYHLKFGGNEKVVEFARSYYTFLGYPYGEKLTYINRSTTETNAAIAAWNRLQSKLISAMRNQLTTSTYTNISPITDNTILLDSISPACQEVASAITSMIDVVKEIISDGAGVIDVTPINTNKSGYWTSTLTYSNSNIIEDPSILTQECADVVSSLNSLYGNVNNILNKISVKRTFPDYIDGENKVFDLYWENGEEVISDPDENLFLTINAVLQRPVFSSTNSSFNSYYIDRTVIPNQLVFDVAPIWDQDFGAKNIGESTAVEKVVGIGVGNYKVVNIDYAAVNNVANGPFLLYDLGDDSVQNIENSSFLYVFIDGVLQKEGKDYEVSGPNIFFKFPILKEMKIDMRYLYGKDIGAVLNIYDFNADSYYIGGKATLQVISGGEYLTSYKWMGEYVGKSIHAYQFFQDGTINTIGEVSNLFLTGNTLTFELFNSKSCVIDTSLNVYFAVGGLYNINTFITISSSSIVYNKDDDQRFSLSAWNNIWSGTSLGKTYKNPFLNLTNGDLVRIEGESTFRKIENLPTKVSSKENRTNEVVTNSIFGTVDVSSYNGITKGEGLSVIAKIENGKVVDLEWNQRVFNPLSDPTAYGYFTPPVLQFIPLDGNGGGARANVLVCGGHVLSIDLIDGGSGYTKEPKVIVSRRFEILSERDIGVSLVTLGVETIITRSDTVLGSQVTIVPAFPPIVTSSSTVVSGPFNINEEIELEINPASQLVGDKVAPNTQPSTYWISNEAKLEKLDYQIQLSLALQSILTNTAISSVGQFTTSFENLIPNDALTNRNYYATGAYLQVDLGLTDTIVYIADTSKFKNNGYLLIGNETVYYSMKLSDRFLKVERGSLGTTAKEWSAGTFLLELPDPISSAFGGVVIVQSESALVSVSGGLSSGGVSQVRTEYQVLTDVLDNDVKVELSAFRFVTTGAVDVYGSYASNRYQSEYLETNLGYTLSHFNGLFADGTANVSGITIEELSNYYPLLTIQDFDETDTNVKSHFTRTGAYFNILPPSIQNPMAILNNSSVDTSNSNFTIQTTQNLSYFPSSGYLYIGQSEDNFGPLYAGRWAIISYTGKSGSSFTGCNLINRRQQAGDNFILQNARIIPYDLT